MFIDKLYSLLEVGISFWICSQAEFRCCSRFRKSLSLPMFVNIICLKTFVARAGTMVQPTFNESPRMTANLVGRGRRASSLSACLESKGNRSRVPNDNRMANRERKRHFGQVARYSKAERELGKVVLTDHNWEEDNGTSPSELGTSNSTNECTGEARAICSLNSTRFQINV